MLLLFLYKYSIVKSQKNISRTETTGQGKAAGCGLGKVGVQPAGLSASAVPAARPNFYPPALFLGAFPLSLFNVPTAL